MGKKMRCADCHYRRPIADGPSAVWVCHYLLDTEELRGMPVEECYKKHGTPYRPRGKGIYVPGPNISHWRRMRRVAQ